MLVKLLKYVRGTSLSRQMLNLVEPKGEASSNLSIIENQIPKVFGNRLE